MLTIMVLAIIFTGVLPVSGEQQSPEPAGDKPAGSSATNLAAAPSRNVICEIQNEGTTIKCDWTQAVPESYFSRLFTAENTPSIALFVVGTGGTVVAICTLIIIARQTKATEESAHTALLNTQALINSERPYIVITVESPAPNQLHFIATNAGRTPADLKSIWTIPIVTNDRESVQIPLDDTTKESHMNTPPCLLPPSASQVVLRCNIEELGGTGLVGEGRIKFSFGWAELRFYGRIRYKDMLQPDNSPVYETKWLYWQLPIEGGLPFPDPFFPSSYPGHRTYS